MIWFWTAYIAAGTYLLIPGIVPAWETDDSHWGIKVLGTIIAVVGWPLMFFTEDK